MQPWIRSARYDGLLILAPPFLALALVLAVPPAYRSTTRMPLLAWVGLVLLIDVAHVYGTLFQTYFDPVRRRQWPTLLWAAPLACYAAGVALHGVSGLLFWQVLAYLAVFHFIRQQYGFLRLYARHECAASPGAATRPLPGQGLAAALIYYATIYPLLYWHFSPPRNFNWFVAGDFVQRDWPAGRLVATVLYSSLIGLYLLREAAEWRRTGQLNVPRNLLLTGTLVSWYAGIVWFNGDLAFTLLNVVSHGIPYLALVWSTGAAPLAAPAVSVGRRRGPWAGRYGLAVFLGLIAVFAYLEEGLWDGLVWREHQAAFGWFQSLPPISRPTLLMWLVPLLALPQATHYVLDGFIWRRKR
ncbi:hypothetical protein [uncultured Hymenobacter sp.]|uniref:hypothetical protein n=1 Tax=uncultured Hymenobacter sp. TaxID=170016 RepID=UPI0035CB06DA